MTSLGGFGVPGMGAGAPTYESEILWGGDESKGLALFQGCVYSGAIRAAGMTPTTLIPPGLLIGKVSASGEEEEWDSTATDGTQNIDGVTPNSFRAQDFEANNQDRLFRKLVRGPVKAKRLLIKGAAFVGHADEFLARRQMAQAGFIFDDDPFNYLSGLTIRSEAVSANTSVAAAQNGTTFFQTQAGATTFTLPEIKAGLEYTFISLVDQNMIIASSEGDNIIIENDVSADSITFSTASKKMGAQLTLESRYANGTLKWIKRSQPGFTETTAT